MEKCMLKMWSQFSHIPTQSLQHVLLVPNPTGHEDIIIIVVVVVVIIIIIYDKHVSG
jgi:hypothetical protein